MERSELADGLTTETYEDALGREQWRVIGPKSRILVTQGRRNGPWEVWHPNSLDPIYRTRDRGEAIARAQFAAANPDI